MAKTRAEDAGIIIQGENKWIMLIENARMKTLAGRL